MRPSTARNGGLDAIRLAGAALVFASHGARAAGIDLAGRGEALGPLGVGMFFVLSGYLIPKAWGQRPGTTYFWGRGLRILPGYWFALIGLVLVTGHPAGPDALVMLQPMGAPNAILGVAWTLRIELVFYALVPLLAMLPTWAIVGLGSASFLLFESQPATQWLMDPQSHFWRFVPGMLLARASVPRLPWSVGAIGVAVAVLSLAAWRPIELGAIGATLLVAIAISRDVAVPRWVVFGSTISYGIYLWHHEVLWWLHDAGAAPWVVIAGGAVLTMLFATVSWFVVERPAMGLARGRLRPARQREEPTPVMVTP